MQPPSGPNLAANHSLKVYHRIATLFLLLTVGVVGLVVYVVMGRATVVVLSAQEPAETDLIVDVSRDPGEEEVAGEIVEATDSLSQQFPSASLAKVDAHAEGRVRISSRLSRAQTLIATTRLLTPDDVLFRIKETVSVPAGGSVEVDAFADQAGASGDVGHATFTIPGLNPELRKLFAVETVSPMAGGVKEVRMVTKGDVETATKVLREKLEQDLIAALRGKANGFAGEVLTTEVTGALTDVPVGAEAEMFTLTVSAKTTGVFYDKEKFKRLVERRLRETVPFDRVLLNVEEEAMAQSLEKTDPGAGRANIKVKARGATVLSPRSPALDPAKLTGISVEAAETYLEKIEGVSSATVRVSPFWAGRTPNIAKNITIEVR
jgi:hypothetical protein